MRLIMNSSYRILLTISFVLIVGISNAQTKSSFPADFVGNWKGTLEWTQAGKSEPERVEMQLNIQPSKDTAGQYTWNLVYGKAATDNRPYILKVADNTKGHWQIDEKNGIVLDQFWIANRLCGSFTVKESTINNSYWIENGKLHLEFVSCSSSALSTTGVGDATVPLVTNYAVKSYQKAVLSK
ncbi:MAG: hypothetical protein H7Y31_03760 [Chitinophagaceae bacterium]|nr:hypothetical protein [Chitinophagaceae bacterium]